MASSTEGRLGGELGHQVEAAAEPVAGLDVADAEALRAAAS